MLEKAQNHVNVVWILYCETVPCLHNLTADVKLCKHETVSNQLKGKEAETSTILIN